MSQVEVVLLYSPGGLWWDGIVSTIGRTSAPAALSAVREQLLTDAEEQAAYWLEADPVLGALKATEAEKLATMLALVLPREALQPDLRLVPDSSETHRDAP